VCVFLLVFILGGGGGPDEYLAKPMLANAMSGGYRVNAPPGGKSSFNILSHDGQQSRGGQVSGRRSSRPGSTRSRNNYDGGKPSNGYRVNQAPGGRSNFSLGMGNESADNAWGIGHDGGARG